MKTLFGGDWMLRIWAASLLLGSAAPLVRAAAAGPEVDVILWFDTEDYLLPASDDATKRLATLLSERGIRATFKVVGEKARTLERRGRRDVIQALQAHDIGFHANYHSVHPAPAEYLAECDLLDGVAEFVRREGPGAADVRRIFGRSTLVCYGQPGSSWAAQAMAGLKEIGVAPHGVPCYVDEGTHVGLGHQPFWYAGVLTVYDMGPNVTRVDLHDRSALEPAQKKFAEIAAKLREAGGGLISIYYHPCEWVHREFWDAVNFRRGANPPPELWKAPPQRPAEETEAAFEQFAKYIDFLRQWPGIRFVTAGELPVLYPDALHLDGVDAKGMASLAQQLLASQDLNFYVTPSFAASVADQFELLTVAVEQLIRNGKVEYPLRVEGLLGPDSPSRAPSGSERIAWPAFRQAVRDVHSFITAHHRVPARVFIGADAIDPAAFLFALASAYREHPWENPTAGGDSVRVRPYRALVPASSVAQDTPELFGGWVIHREGFRAPHILEVARLQTWTLKPAIRSRGF